MVIENEKRTIRVKMRRFLIALIAFLLIIFSVVTDWAVFFKNSNYYIAALVLIIYSLIYAYGHILNYNYIYYNDEGQNIIIRFYSIRFMQNINKSYEIPKKDFLGYYIEKKFFNKKTTILLKQKYKNKTATYPALSLSLLNSNEIKKITGSLDKYSKYKK